MPTRVIFSAPPPWDQCGLGVMLATRQEVESELCWEGVFAEVELVASAVGGHTEGYAYPPLPAGRECEYFQVSVRHLGSRDAALEDVCEATRRLFLQAAGSGRVPWVILHCNQSIHRGPVLAVAVVTRVSVRFSEH